MIEIRCSSLDRVVGEFGCAGSTIPTAAPYNPNNPIAREGTEGHKMAEAIVHGGDVQSPYLDAATADLFDRRIRDAWVELKQWLPDPKTEVAMQSDLSPDVRLTGHADCLSVSPGRISVLDWKFGWGQTEHQVQIKGYALLASRTHGMPMTGLVNGFEVWIRSGEIRTYRWEKADLDALAEEVVSQVEQGPQQYAPSATACRYCPRQLECPARARWLHAGVALMLPMTGNVDLHADVGALYDRRREIGRALEVYDGILEHALDQGPVPLPNGKQLQWDTRLEDKIIPYHAMDVLRGIEPALNAAEWNDILKITKAGIERTIKARAPKGKAAGLMREAMASFDEAGAVEKTAKRIKKVV